MEIIVTRITRVIKKISRCYHECPYFSVTSDGMNCEHPFFDDKGPWDSMIISHPDCDNGFPKLCPLLKENHEG